jgi:hypothetical protein
MKYLIQDTESHTLGEINNYFRDELKKTNLNPEDILIDETLSKKIAIMEMDRIFEENGISEFYELGLEGFNGIHLKQTGNYIEFSEDELSSRFNDAFKCILSGLV